MTDAKADTTGTGTGTLAITVDGRSVEARPGELLIAVAERAGTYIPRFCYHPRMRPVGMCRMCLVEIDTGRGPALGTACTVAVAEGMTVDTESERVKKAQDGVLEFLLINHPLDCPVCDKGGECPLQDQTLAFGPGESRFVEEKRHFEKPIALSDLVLMDRERCILCDRCTRFGREVSGEPLISFIERGNETEVNTFPDHPFASYFSGNTVQICPVGALTAKPYRFKARPWDLDQVESTCTSCAVGCRVAVQSSADAVVRYLGVDVDPVNWGWLCDKGRFDFEAVNSADRLGAPLLRNASEELVEVGWGEALGRAAEILTGACAGGIGVLGGARLTNEDAYAWSKLARTVLHTDSVDAQLGDGLPAEAVLGLPRATIDEACAAGTVVLLAPDLEEELPVLYLRLRHAVVTDGLAVVELSPTATAMTDLATVSLRHRPGEAASLVRSLLAGDDAGAGDQASALGRARALLDADSVVCVLGRPSLAESAEPVMAAAGALLDGVPGIRFLPALRRSNVMGALDMGLAPGLLPGRVGLEEGRNWFGGWGELPAEPGLDTAAMLRAAADGHLAALVLLGADPLADFPDRELARRALVGAGAVVAVDCFVTGSVRLADVALAAAGYAEKTGTTTNIEGRVSRLNAKVSPPGTARPDWVIAAELAQRMGADLGLDSVEAIWDEIERLAPSHAGLTGERLASPEGLDGIVAGAAPAPAEGDAPPVMSQADEPAVMAVAAHMGPGAVASAGSGRGAVPAPEEGSAPAGAAEAPGEAAGAAGDTADYGAGQSDASGEAEAVESSVEASHGGGRSEDRPAGDGSADASGAEGAGRPSLLRWSPAEGSAASAAGPTLAADRSSFRLVSARRLYDAGTLVQHSPSLAALAAPLPVRLHPSELARLGVEAGSEVRVSSRQGSVVLETVGDVGVPQGTAAITFNQPGPGAADLIDADATVTDVRIETLPGEGDPRG